MARDLVNKILDPVFPCSTKNFQIGFLFGVNDGLAALDLIEDTQAA
jgi:hypothetical protein